MATPVMPTFIGAGIGFRKPHRAALLEGEPCERPRMLEIIPAHFFADPPAIDALAQAYPLVFHEVGLSIGTASGPADEVTRALLGRIRALAARAQPILMSDHLAVTRSPAGIDLGHLCPILPTRETLDLLTGRVHAFQDLLGVPFALENIALPFELPGELTEAELFAELVSRTGCGMLLDLTNLVLNSKNFGFEPTARLQEYPLEAVWQVHLAGGRKVGDFWVDTHSAPVGNLELELLSQLRRRATALKAIVIERDEALPPLPELVAEARRAEQLWRTVEGTPWPST